MGRKQEEEPGGPSAPTPTKRCFNPNLPAQITEAAMLLTKGREKK
jgi:hypothetical protein